MDDRLRNLERLARQGDPQAIAALQAARKRVSTGEKLAPLWYLEFMQGASGNWYLHWARRHGGNRLFGPHIPRHILVWAGVREDVLDHQHGGPWPVSQSTRNVLERPEPFMSDTVIEMKRGRRASFSDQDTREIRLVKARIPSPLPRYSPPMLNLDNASAFGNEEVQVYYGSVRQGRHWWGIVTVDDEHYSGRIYGERFPTRRQADAAALRVAEDYCSDNGIQQELEPNE